MHMRATSAAASLQVRQVIAPVGRGEGVCRTACGRAVRAAEQDRQQPCGQYEMICPCVCLTEGQMRSCSCSLGQLHILQHGVPAPHAWQHTWAREYAPSATHNHLLAHPSVAHPPKHAHVRAAPLDTRHDRAVVEGIAQHKRAAPRQHRDAGAVGGKAHAICQGSFCAQERGHCRLQLLVQRGGACAGQGMPGSSLC